MSHVLIGPTELFVAAWCDQGEEHVKAWRWHWFIKGVEKLKRRNY